MNETPEQWAERIIETIVYDGVRVSDDTGLPRTLIENMEGA